jgi:hypothetical protein
MAMTKPSPPPYNPADDLKEEGQFRAVCTGVRQGIPWPEYPKNTRVAIEFTVSDPLRKDLRGKKCAIVCGDSIYKDKRSGKESHLLQYARMAGATSPQLGFDPDTLLDKWFMIQTEVYNGKAMVRRLMPVGAPSVNEPLSGIAEFIDPATAEMPPNDEIPF